MLRRTGSTRATRWLEVGSSAEVHVNAGAYRAAPTDLIEKAVRRTLAQSRVEEAEISVTLLDDPGIEALNTRYLGENHATDVLAFSLGDERVIGDVYIGLERARCQADELSVPLSEELVRLAIHGTLHVLGHDHPRGPERTQSPMFELQERLVRDVLEIP